MRKNGLKWMLVGMLSITILCGCSSQNGESTQGNSEGKENMETKAAVDDEQVYRMKLSYNSPELTEETSLETKFAQTLKRYLEENAPGRFEIEIYPGAQLGSFSEVFSGVSDGNIETALVNISTLISNDDKLNVWQIPGSIGSNEDCNLLLSSEETLSTFDTVEENMGITVLTSFSAGARHFTNNKREIKVPQDMNGVMFRVMENELYVKMVESMGGIATPMSSSELYSALQNGVVDGQENPTAFIISDMTYEVQKYMVTDGHVYSISPFVVNSEWYNGLPDELRTVLNEGVEEARNAAIAFVEKQEVEGIEFLKNNGVSVYEPTEEEMNLWHETVFNGTYDYITELIGKDTVDDFLNKAESVLGN